jgi:hypothetical protein
MRKQKSTCLRAPKRRKIWLRQRLEAAFSTIEVLLEDSTPEDSRRAQRGPVGCVYAISLRDRRGKPSDVIILDSLAADVPRFNRGGEHSSSQRGTAAWRRDRTRGATLKSRTSSLRSIGANNDHTDSS